MATNRIPWKSITIKDWRHFEELVENLTYREWVFRGQSDSSWGIKSSLLRLFEDVEVIYHEYIDKKASKQKYKNKKRIIAKNMHERLLINNFQASGSLVNRCGAPG